MTKGRNQHVVPRDGGWAVKPEGGQRVSSIYGTQREAIDRGREVSRNQHSELFVHGRGGRIRERDSHGHDSNPPKGFRRRAEAGRARTVQARANIGNKK
jgi:Uncharacterized protein conserved in bacteria (DUF2188)